MKCSIHLLHSRPRWSMFCFALSIVTSVFMAKDASAAYTVYGLADVSAGGNGEKVEDFYVPQTAIADGVVVHGAQMDSAIGMYKANLATGIIGTYISGFSASDWTAGGRARASFSENLSLEFPAGYYDTDQYVEVEGQLTGTLSASGCDLYNRCSSASVSYSFWLGTHAGNDYFSGNPSVSSGDAGFTINTKFKLRALIVRAGTTFSTPTELGVAVSADLSGNATAITQEGLDFANALHDFYQSGRLLAVHVPPGVTWTSESGVFLSRVPKALPWIPLLLLDD